MNIFVDTNIIFSAKLNPTWKISDLLLDPSDHFTFFAPDLLISGLDRHHTKLISISKFSEEDISFLKRLLLSKLVLVDLVSIDQKDWQKALELVERIDEFDAPFLVLSLKMNTYLWTGDKKLKKGLQILGYDKVIDKDVLLQLRNAID